MSTEYLATLSLSGLGYAAIIPTPEDNINVLHPPLPNVGVSMSITPQGGIFSYTAGTTTYATSAHTNPSATVLTFTASASLPPLPENLQIVEYLWNFGDDTTAFGNPVQHTYPVAFSPQVTLRVLDSYGRYWYGRRQMYLT